MKKMFLKVIFLLSIISASLILFFGKRDLLQGAAKNDLYYQVGCNIYSLDGELVKSFAGSFCVFLEDGSFFEFSYTGPHANRLVKYSTAGKVLSSTELIVWHQLKLNEAQNKILVQSAYFRFVKGKSALVPTFSIFNLDGKELYRFDSLAHMNQIDLLADSFEIQLKKIVFPGAKVFYETDHANSIYEIPENPNSKINPAFNSGNYLLSYYGKGLLLIVDSTLSKILWAIKLKEIEHFHDAQLLSSGNILIYNNRSKENLYSELLIIDPFSQEVLWRYQDIKNNFRSLLGGGVQMLNDYSFLYSDSGVDVDLKEGNFIYRFEKPGISYFVEIDFWGNEIKRFQIYEKYAENGLKVMQDAKKVQLGGFLQNNKM